MPSALAWLTNRSRYFGFGVGVEGDDLGAGVARLGQRVAEGLGVVGGEHDRIGALLRLGVDVLRLRVRAGLLRPDLGVLAAELLDGLLAAGVAGVEVGVAEVLRDERDRRGLRVAAATAAAAVALALAAAGWQRAPARGSRPRAPAALLEWNFMMLTFPGFQRLLARAGGRVAPVVRLAAASETHARTLVDITEATSSSPMMMLMTLTVTPCSRRALEITPISRTPAMTPCSLPRPPKIETPPSRTAAITWSSRPGGVVAAGAGEAQREVDAREGARPRRRGRTA